ncbi:MAG: reverse transcriptase family protein [Verrucomicrobiales bacterium]
MIVRLLKRLLFGARRDVSLLDADGEAIDETIDLSGKPLKQGHLRKGLRDRRLVPKVLERRRGKRGSKSRYLETDEAARLFSHTQLTCNRNLRDLTADREQLARLNLPQWQSEQDIADALGIPLKTLWHYSIHRNMERFSHYVTFAIAKRSGGERLIMAPKSRLRAMQRQLVTLLVRQLPLHDAAHGFRRGHSIRSGADCHARKQVVVRVDLADFFPTVHFGRVRGYLIACGYSYPVATTLAVLMTEAERQPVEVDGTVYHVPVTPRYCVQGAPTSPGICNAIVRKLDNRLAGLARQFQFDYTRYADDLTFSGAEPNTVPRLLKLIGNIVESEGFNVNAAKTRVMRKGRRQSVTGVTVNEVIGLSRKERRKLRAALHQQKLNGVPGDCTNQQLHGKLAYLHMLNPSQAMKLKSDC